MSQQTLPMPMPEQPQLVARARELLRDRAAGRPERTGKVLMKDAERVEQILVDLINECSERSIARRYHVARESIQVIRKLATEAGMLRPLKERVVAQLTRFVELTTERLVEAMEEGELSPAQLSVPLGIALDKLERLQSGGQREGSSGPQKGQVDAAAVAAWIEALPTADPTSDSVSEGQYLQVVDVQTVALSNSGRDTGSDTPPAGQDASTDTGAKGGGGGLGRSGGHVELMGKAEGGNR